MSEGVTFDCQPSNTQKAISSVYSELLSSNEKLNLRPAYQRSLVWKAEQKSYYIDTIMNNCPSPIFLLYMYDPDDEYECIDGQNRLSTIKEYIEQTGEESEPFPWKKETDEGEENVYYLNEKTKDALQAYCDAKNGKRKGMKAYRLMTPAEVKRFSKYELSLSQIKTRLDFNQRQDIFMRWQNGTSISPSDAFKNEEHPFCRFVVQNSIDRTLSESIRPLLKKAGFNKTWIWDTYLLLNAFRKDSLCEVILGTIQVKGLIVKDTETLESHYKETQQKLEKFLPKLKPLEKMKRQIYMSFLLGYVFLWRKLNPELRPIAESEKFLEEFATESLENDEHPHSTLNSAKQATEFVNAFPKFEASFYACLERHMPPSPPPPNPKKREPIPPGVRKSVWKTYIGEEKGVGLCFCCGSSTISSMDFHAGHIKPDKQGGKPTVGNLRPLCAPCNLGMGTQNMVNYVRKHHPNRLEILMKSILGDE